MLSVTAVVPTYNSKTIDLVIDSILNQTVAVKEIILVDDASTDQSCIEKLRRLADIKSTIPITIHWNTHNKGPSASRNIGWDLATGDLIAFLDGDDFWEPNKVEVQSQWMFDHPDFLLTGHLHNLQKTLSSRSLSFNNILFKNYMATGSIMVRRHITLRFNEKLRFCEDHKFLLDVSFIHPIYIIGQVLMKLGRPILSKGGLSGNLTKMRISQLRITMLLFKEQKIDLKTLLLLQAKSILAHFIRCLGFKN